MKSAFVNRARETWFSVAEKALGRNQFVWERNEARERTFLFCPTFFCFLSFLWRLVCNIFLCFCCCFVSLFVLFYLFYFIIIFVIAGLVFFFLLQNAFAIVDLPTTLSPRHQKLYVSSPSQWTSLLSSYDRASCFSNVLDNASLAWPICTLWKSNQNLPTTHEKRWILERLSDSFV